jgi:hypothetical protein
MTEEKTTTHPKVPITVVVSQMPEKAATPLFKDSTRLLSLAAFIFSVATGLFTTYQTLQASKKQTIEDVMKLIDQYYEGAEKLSHVNPSQTDAMNLLQAELRGKALRAITEASSVKKELDDGTWLALAQINLFSYNFDASKIAWNAVLDNSSDLGQYMFASRGLASVQLQQDDNNGAEKILNNAIETVMAERFKGVPNSFPVYIRNIEAAVTHAFWLSKAQTKQCEFISFHFDKSLDLMTKTYSTANPVDPGYQNHLLWIRPVLSNFRKQRESCPPDVKAELIDADQCDAIADIADNARTGFAIFRGAATNSGKDNSDVWARAFLPESDGCFVDSNYKFYCKWPEKG